MDASAPLRQTIALGLALLLWPLLWPSVAWAQAVTLTPHHTFRMAEAPTALAFSSDGSTLLAGDANGQITGWAVQDQTTALQTRLDDEIRFLGFLSGDTSFVSVDKDGVVSVRPLDGAAPPTRFDLDETPRAVALDASRTHLAVATEDDQIHLLNLQAGMTRGRIDTRGALEAVRYLGFDRLGQRLIAITREGTVLTWNPATQQRLRELALSGGDLHGSRSVIRAAATNRASNVFVVALEEVALPEGGLRGRARPGDLTRRHVIVAYDWSTGLEIKRIDYPEGPARQLVLGPGSDHVAVVPNEGARLTLVNVRRGEAASTVSTPGETRTLARSGDDTWLAAGTETGRIAVWQVQQSDPPTASRPDTTLPSLSGRIRVLSTETPALSADTSAQVAVLPFQSKGDPTRIADMCSSALTTQLANVEHLTLLERERIDAVIDELNFSASELTESKGMRIGHVLNADYLILGTLNALGSTYLFNARLLHVETSRVVAGRQVICEECQVQDVFDAIHLLGTTLAQK
jgi:WD40 repeat protein